MVGLEDGPQKSNYRAVVDPEECVACGECTKSCSVEAITEDEDGKAKIIRDKCIGCGVCVIGCPNTAMVLEPVSEQEWFHTPASMEEWEEMRLEYLAAQKN